MKLRITCFLLLLALIFGLSCVKPQPENNPKTYVFEEIC